MASLAEIHPEFSAAVEAAKTQIDAYAKRAANDNVKPKSLQVPAEVLAAQKERFEFTHFDEVSETATKEWLVKDFLGAGEFSLFVAKPGTAKSVLLCDIGCHIAAGRDWHGRKVSPGLVVFFAAERKGLTERRVAAWRKKHGVTGIPFVVAGGRLDMTSGLIDAKTLAAAIRRLEQQVGHKCVLVILDTVTRTFGGGDQNASKDMQRFIASVDELHRSTSAHVAAIHHSGWEGDRGKGAIDLDGAIDVSFGVTVTGKGPSKAFKLECTGTNDGEEGVITSFRLESVPLGVDADGNETTAPVVVAVKVTPASLTATVDGVELKGESAKAFESLRAAIYASGEAAPYGATGFPEDVPTVSRDAWRERFYADARAKEPDIDAEALRKRWQRASVKLIEAGQVGAYGDRVWLP